ncbi:uncharacterized protein LOC141711576 [Apium graveolens]|uniref:uncharacterized protein LOC141711576 n=1 Tax=Apium graveolens TaxID=4045 RepID=UPI003D7A7936
MARTNKYASLNFNDIYDKRNNSKTTLNNNNNSNASSSINKPKITNSHIHGNMLVLTRPTPKPISQAQAQKQTQPPPPDPTRLDSDLSSDSISLRPLGSTGGSGGLPRDLCFVAPKSDKFVPPHLRPGFICKEEKPVVEFVKKEFNRKLGGDQGSNRPKSGGGGGGGGGGYDRMRRGSAGPDFVFRPGSSGGYNRPNSSG